MPKRHVPLYKSDTVTPSVHVSRWLLNRGWQEGRLWRRYLDPLAGLALALHVFASCVECSQGPVWAVGNERVRVVFLTEEAVDTAKAQFLMDIVADQAPIPGLPIDILIGKRMTISLAAEPSQGVDASSDAVRRLIVLPLVDAFAWEPEKLRRTIRHELAHIGMGVFLNYVVPPPWFQEGFAEWASGGLTCQGEARIRVELLMRRRLEQPSPQFLGPARFGRSRLSYDLLATLFEYIEQSSGGVVGDGTLLEGVKAHGFDAGLSEVLGVDLGELEFGWQSYLLDRYDGLPEGLSCVSNGADK